MTFRISKKYKNSDWLKLGVVDSNDKNWDNAIAIIKDRFDSRFFSHITLIEKNKFSGFLIMSIDCLIIETMMQFYLGVRDTEVSYRRNQIKAFEDFFEHSSHFNADFDTPDKRQEFYRQFRCGLLHQAEVKKKSLIKISQPLLTLVNNNASEGLIINRKKFHEKLLLEFNDYLEKLRNNQTNFKGESLRDKAILKMNIICRVLEKTVKLTTQFQFKLTTCFG